MLLISSWWGWGRVELPVLFREYLCDNACAYGE